MGTIEWPRIPSHLVGTIRWQRIRRQLTGTFEWRPHKARFGSS